MASVFGYEDAKRRAAYIASLLMRGKVVVLPTETVPGFFFRADDRAAIGHVCRIKGYAEGERGFALQVTGADDAAFVAVADGQAAARRIAREFWPGPVTIVIERDGRTTAFRCPDNELTLTVLGLCDCGVYGTSVNRAGEEPETDCGRIARLYANEDLAVVDAGVIAGVPTTVVRVDGREITFPRIGGVMQEEILRVIENEDRGGF